MSEQRKTVLLNQDDDGLSPVLEEFRRKTLIQDQYRAAFFKLPQRDQLKTLVARAIIDVYGSSWTTGECREIIAESAAAEYDRYDRYLAAVAHNVLLEQNPDPDDEPVEVPVWP